MSNIIFLDIDGVLNHNPWKNKYLNEITDVETAEKMLGVKNENDALDECIC